jgi:hypothetical protein
MTRISRRIPVNKQTSLCSHESAPPRGYFMASPIVKRVHAVHVGALKDAAALKAPIAVRNC